MDNLQYQILRALDVAARNIAAENLAIIPQLYEHEGIWVYVD